MDQILTVLVKLKHFEKIRAVEGSSAYLSPDRMIARGLPEEAINLAEELFRSTKLMKLLKKILFSKS